MALFRNDGGLAFRMDHYGPHVRYERALRVGDRVDRLPGGPSAGAVIVEIDGEAAVISKYGHREKVWMGILAHYNPHKSSLRAFLGY